MGWWRRIRNPKAFQGSGKKAPYFEGWYFKLVSEDQSHAVALIPGIARGDDSHAFLQVIDGREGTMRYLRYQLSQFEAREDRMDIRLAGHAFSDKHIKLDGDGMAGELMFVDPVPWHATLARPGIMGWYSYMPFMQCYHGLVSANHHLQGGLKLDDAFCNFSGGKGYSEKDWGRSFPRSWIWMQCNHFEEELSIMASVAHIPWVSTHFIGFLALIWYRGRLNIYTTYTGADYQADIHDEVVQLEFADKNSKLRISANQLAGVELRSPIDGEMKGKVNESIQATMSLKYLIEDQMVFEGKGSSAGLEVAGDVGELLTGFSKNMTR